MTGAAAPASELLRDVVDLLREARASAPDPEASSAIDEIGHRLDQPLRVAIAGKVKAGKSTLLNALVGDELAPTDARECTQVVTWYRNGHTYRVELFDHDGTARQCPFRRRDGALEIDLGGTAVDAVDRLEVWWPSAQLADVTLIDTPGIGSISTDLSARTYAFLTTDDDQPTTADAVLYLVRHLHNTDVRFLEAFHDDELVNSTPVNAIGVLSRADEIGSCRLGAMDTAHRVADRYRGDPRIRQLCRTVIPVAGLVAQAGVTLREHEFRSLAELASDPRRDLTELALTADRFASPKVDLGVPADERRRLLGRLGLFGVRLALDLIRTRRATTSPQLAAELVRASGVAELQQALRTQLMSRSRPLKARSSLVALMALLQTRPWPRARELASRAEMITSSAHEIVEIRLLTDIWLGDLALRDEGQTAEIERLLGGHGTASRLRLGLAEDASIDDQRAAAVAARERWSQVAEHPMSSMTVRSAARGAARTCEGILMSLDRASSGTATGSGDVKAAP
jgi:hypothetical protein